MDNVQNCDSYRKIGQASNSMNITPTLILALTWYSETSVYFQKTKLIS
jgi:hypothetical protein